MINSQLLYKLSQITEEEKNILNGKKSIDTNIYMNKRGSVINSKKLLSKGKLITARPHTRFLKFPRHSHDFVEVMYVCKGSITHIINGNDIVVREGELLFLGQNTEHEIEKSSENDVAVNFIILPEFFDSPLAMLKYDNSPLKSFIVDSLVDGKEGLNYLHFKVSDNLLIQNCVENLIEILINDTSNKRTVSGYTMGLIFLHLSNCTDCLTYQSAEENAVMQVLKYIDENYRDGSLAELSKKLHYDYTWLSREIKRKTGKTYTEIVQDRKMSQAAFLLKNTDMKINDILENIGYDNRSYFFKLFYKIFQKKPGEYRKSTAKL